MTDCYCTGECKIIGRCPNADRGGFFDLPAMQMCRDSSHNFPTHLYIPPGKGYRHVCPSCGREQTVIAPQIT